MFDKVFLTLKHKGDNNDKIQKCNRIWLIMGNMCKYNNHQLNDVIGGGMRRTIKDKTRLRKIIKNSIGNTGSLDMIEFYDDWSWETMSCSTYSSVVIVRIQIGMMISPEFYTDTDDQAITRAFRRVERMIDYYITEGERLAWDIA